MAAQSRRFGGDVVTFAWAWLTVWQAYLTGGIAQAAVNVYERQAGHSISWVTYRWGVVAFFVSASFVIWRRERHRAEELEEKAARAPDLTHVLTNQLRLTEEFAVQSSAMMELQGSHDELKAFAYDQARRLQGVQPIIAAVERDAPRHLTYEARRIIINHMRPLVEQWTTDDNGRPPQMQVVYQAEGGDTFSYSYELENALRSAGFEMVIGRGPHPKSADGMPDDYRQGIFILQDDDKNKKAGRPDFASALSEALSEAGIEAQKLNRPDVLFSLIVGARVPVTPA